MVELGWLVWYRRKMALLIWTVTSIFVMCAVVRILMPDPRGVVLEQVQQAVTIADKDALKYKRDIEAVIKGAYAPSSRAEYEAAREKAAEYFTQDCLDEFMPKGKQVKKSDYGLGIEINKLLFGVRVAGNNDQPQTLYVQADVFGRGRRWYVDIEFKINDSGSIYDYDVI